jgi:WD40 repeat protein
MALSPDGQQLLTTGSDGLIRLWELETGLELTGWGGTNNSPITPAWLPDGQQIALTFSDNLLGIYQVEDGEPVVTTKAHTGQIGSVAWAPDGRGLVSGSSGDNLTRFWNIESRQEVGVMPGFTGEGQSLTISDDGSLMAKPSVGIQVFDLSAGFQADFEPIFSGGGDAYVNAAALSPNAEQVAAINWDGFLRVWNLADQALIVDVGGAGAEAIAWSPDGELIATPAHDESLVVIWDSQTGEGLQAIPYGTDANITSLVWSPDGRFLAATDTAGTLNVWERDSWGIALSFQSLGTSLNSIDWSPDGHWLAAGAWSGSLYVWDATGTAVEEPVLYIDLAHLGPVITVAWSPDGNWIATGSHDGTVKIWGQ